jgi:hypothetical protein
MPLEPIPCLTLDRLADVLDRQARRAGRGVYEPPGRGMT